MASWALNWFFPNNTTFLVQPSQNPGDLPKKDLTGTAVADTCQPRWPDQGAEEAAAVERSWGGGEGGGG